jgi:hypothetical protein
MHGAFVFRISVSFVLSYLHAGSLSYLAYDKPKIHMCYHYCFTGFVSSIADYWWFAEYLLITNYWPFTEYLLITNYWPITNQWSLTTWEGITDNGHYWWLVLHCQHHWLLMTGFTFVNITDYCWLVLHSWTYITDYWLITDCICRHYWLLTNHWLNWWTLLITD